MINIEYANAYSEIIEILKYISKEDYNKIPHEQIIMFEANANLEHKFTYNPLKTLDEQNVLKITKGIIAILFIDYWATEIQREKIISKQVYDKQKIEEEKKSKYNTDNLFRKNVKITTINNKEETQETALIEIRNMKWYEKVLTFFKNFFRK